jgi:hypothetical protein
MAATVERTQANGTQPITPPPPRPPRRQRDSDNRERFGRRELDARHGHVRRRHE